MPTVDEYMAMPYRVIILEEKNWFNASVLEFPGCLAYGKTEKQARRRIKRVMRSWLEAVIDAGQTVPPPISVRLA